MMRIGLVRGLVALLLLPGISHALGLGDVHLNSPLNAPLDAEIELVNATPEDLATLDAKLASKDTFARYGLDWPPFMGRDSRWRRPFWSPTKSSPAVWFRFWAGSCRPIMRSMPFTLIASTFRPRFAALSICWRNTFVTIPPGPTRAHHAGPPNTAWMASRSSVALP